MTGAHECNNTHGDHANPSNTHEFGQVKEQVLKNQVMMNKYGGAPVSGGERSI